MSVLLLLIPLSIVLAAGFLAGFIWAVRSGQYDDTGTPPLRLLFEEPALPGVSKARTAATREAGLPSKIGLRQKPALSTTSAASQPSNRNIQP